MQAIVTVGQGGCDQLLRRGGRYVSSGDIGGLLHTLDMRTMYLNDLTLLGSTAWDETVFPNLVRYGEHREIAPLVAGVVALDRIAVAQPAFLAEAQVGKLVRVPAQPE